MVTVKIEKQRGSSRLKGDWPWNIHIYRNRFIHTVCTTNMKTIFMATIKTAYKQTNKERLKPKWSQSFNLGTKTESKMLLTKLISSIFGQDENSVCHTNFFMPRPMPTTWLGRHRQGGHRASCMVRSSCAHGAVVGMEADKFSTCSKLFQVAGTQKSYTNKC